ncbi:MAG: NYN domain-containing protein [Lachnospiraceae bacterium]|nr:NYN domain-containing protein [Lachnospiraceae bacterium]
MGRHINIGIVAHVDAGKTTLTEALLFRSGKLRHLGRVDSRDSFLDTDVQERERGITIYSKQAEFSYEDTGITLLDTPGHVDFSAEAESVLKVLDLCILLVSASDGIKGHTLTLWSLLKQREIPVMIFVNKMDQPGADAEEILSGIRRRLDENCVDLTRFFSGLTEEDSEAVAVCDEALMEEYLTGEAVIDEACISTLLKERKMFPVFFGSALKLQGVDELLRAITAFAPVPEYGEEFAARVFKISRDASGNRLTHLKITGGSLRSREVIGEDKVNQIRIYSGEKYETVNELEAGRICAVTGLDHTKAGMGLGALDGTLPPMLEPVLCYRVTAADGTDDTVLLSKLRQLEEEDPQLLISCDDEDLKGRRSQILIRVMGEVQLEVLKRRVSDRFGIDIRFGEGGVVYKETIASPVEGVGHFEPLRHYAEVHLLLEPAERGSGLSFGSLCSEDILDKNWQRLVLTHLAEKRHRGVLTGSPITDMRISILTGRAHPKHTEGGDFRQATYRAVRQGLMQAESILLEPFYSFRMELPTGSVGKAMTDVENMQGSMQPPEVEGDTAILTGEAPVSCIRNYAKELAAYTAGMGRISLSLSGYGPCHNTEEVLAEADYRPEEDLRNTPDSVFCAHGAGFVVPWNEVYDYMHLESAYHGFTELNERSQEKTYAPRIAAPVESAALGTEEVDHILNRTFYANSESSVKSETEKRKGVGRKAVSLSGTIDFDEAYSSYEYTPSGKKKKYLVVDGYNIIFAWEELRELAKENLDSARDKLCDIMADHAGLDDAEVILVFDAYKVPGRKSSVREYGSIQIVFTGEGETADQYIERFAGRYGKKCDVTVATSDALEQSVVWGSSCRRLSARELEAEVARRRSEAIENWGKK